MLDRIAEGLLADPVQLLLDLDGQLRLETGEGPVLGKKLELTALHKDGREFPIELSITEAVRSENKARIRNTISAIDPGILVEPKVHLGPVSPR